MYLICSIISFLKEFQKILVSENVFAEAVAKILGKQPKYSVRVSYNH